MWQGWERGGHLVLLLSEKVKVLNKEGKKKHYVKAAVLPVFIS